MTEYEVFSDFETGKNVNGARILVVEDEQDIRSLIGDILSEEGYQVSLAKDGFEAIEKSYFSRPDVVLLDIWLKGSYIDGLGVLERLKAKYPDLPVIIISGHGTVAIAMKSIKLGAHDYIEKPFSEERLRLVVRTAAEISLLRLRVLGLRTGIQNVAILGSSAKAKKLRADLEKAASIPNNRVMITGKQGVGKEVIARMIYEYSAYSNGIFLTLSPNFFTCEDYMDKFFKSYTMACVLSGNIAPNMVLSERVQGGVLFIDEISELPMDFQDRFVNMLKKDNKSHLSKFENDRISPNHMIIASSSKNLQHEIRKGNLKEELYHRLNCFPIYVPSLEERAEDIPELCEHFIGLFCKNMGIKKVELCERALAVLQMHSWQGNIRQLRNVLEWLVIMCGDKGEITEADLPNEIKACFKSQSIDLLSDIDLARITLKEAREEFERRYLSLHLRKCSGSVAKTARAIGMERSALHRKMKYLGLTD